eukprot:gene17017-30932_t
MPRLPSRPGKRAPRPAVRVLEVKKVRRDPAAGERRRRHRPNGAGPPTGG